MSKWFEKKTIGNLPTEAAEKFRNREALSFKVHRWSFFQLAESVDQAAKGLISLGIKPKEKVGICTQPAGIYPHFFWTC